MRCFDVSRDIKELQGSLGSFKEFLRNPRGSKKFKKFLWILKDGIFDNFSEF